jgi:hypothetical protein
VSLFLEIGLRFTLKENINVGRTLFPKLLNQLLLGEKQRRHFMSPFFITSFRAFQFPKGSFLFLLSAQQWLKVLT